MTIHVNIGEAKTRLSQLIAAAVRGEEVVIDRAGKPTARIVSISPEDDRKEKIARRRAFFGSKRGAVTSKGLKLIAEPTFSEEDLDSFEALPDKSR